MRASGVLKRAAGNSYAEGFSKEPRRKDSASARRACRQVPMSCPAPRVPFLLWALMGDWLLALGAPEAGSLRLALVQLSKLQLSRRPEDWQRACCAALRCSWLELYVTERSAARIFVEACRSILGFLPSALLQGQGPWHMAVPGSWEDGHAPLDDRQQTLFAELQIGLARCREATRAEASNSVIATLPVCASAFRS